MNDSPITDPHQPCEPRLAIIKHIINATPEQIADFSRSVGTQTETPRDFRLYTFSEVSKILGISRMTLWRMVKQCKIATVQTSGGNKRISGPALHKYISGR